MTSKSPNRTTGVLFGFLGMLGFSGTLVATRIAVSDFTPFDITTARIVMAGLLGVATLTVTNAWRLPRGQLFLPIAVMGIGLAVGYPLFLALALKSVPAVHGAVVTGLAPAATAIIAVLRTGERPSALFWFACLIGFCTVVYFAYDAGGGHLSLADGWLFLGMVSLGIAYVEGGRVSKELGATTTLCWAMIFLLPFAALALFLNVSAIDFSSVATTSWISLTYLGVISMFLASVFWYRGLALGGIARIGQMNLLLPLTALAWSAIFLGEKITTTAIVCALIVLAAMITCLKTRP